MTISSAHNVIKALVVEDSRLARNGLVSLLSEYPEIEIVGSEGNLDAAVKLVQDSNVDVIFLDIHIPGGTGFDLLERIETTPFIIFTTAYSEHAIRSFDFNTVDYLLKPISQQYLSRAVNKLKGHIESLHLYENIDRNGYPVDQDDETEGFAEQALEIESRIFIRDNENCYLVALKDIRFFESCKNYTRLYFGDNKAFIKRSLNYLEEKLPVKHFFRASRQIIVNLNEVQTIEESEYDGHYLVLREGKKISISRKHLSRLKDLLEL